MRPLEGAVEGGVGSVARAFGDPGEGQSLEDEPRGEAVEKTVVGQDAVIVTLGIPDNPFLVRLTRRASSPLDVRSAGTAQMIAAMRNQGVRRLVVQSTYGIGDGYRRLPLGLKAFFTLAIRPQVLDHERQEGLVRESGLDWTIVRPVVLHDDPVATPARVVLDDDEPTMRVGRAAVADVHVAAVDRPDWVSRTLSLSEGLGEPGPAKVRRSSPASESAVRNVRAEKAQWSATMKRPR